MKTAYSALFVLFLFSCASARFVKPLKEKQQAVSLSLGGPLIDFSNMTIPMPLLSAAYGYGVDSTLTAFGGINITSAIYGNAQVDLGITKQLLKQDGRKPALTVTPLANLIYRSSDAIKFYPQLDVNAFWDFNSKRNYAYVGISNWFELAGTKAHDQQQKEHWLLSPQIGQTFTREKWDLVIEAKVIAPHIYYQSNVVDYKSPFGNNGAFGLYIGYTRKF